MTAVDAAAAARGLRPGLALADARALCPTVRVAEADPDADAALMGAVVDWCRRFTPLAAPDGRDGAVLDIGGASHLFGGEAGLAEALVSGLRRQGLAARAAVASTPEAAWALARFGTEPVAPTPLEPGFAPLAAALPVAALRLDPETVAGLARAGLVRVGDLLGRPRGPIAARFGAAVLARLDGLMGLAKAPIGPRFEALRCVAERRFAGGLAEMAQIEAALLPLCRHLCAALARQGQGARRIAASFFRVDGVVKHLDLGTSRPTREPARLLHALFHEKLAAIGEHGLDTGYGFDLIRLAVTEAERLDVRPGEPRRRTIPARGLDAALGDTMADLADRLGARLGLAARRQARAPQDTHIPECAVVALPAAPGPPHAASGGGGRSRRAGRSASSTGPSASTRSPRCRTARRCAFAGVASCTTSPPSRGPSGSRPNGGTARTELTRDYFRAEDRDGRRFWLYREGQFGRETDAPRWYLHGLFG